MNNKKGEIVSLYDDWTDNLDENKCFLHSRCCNANWELLVDTKTGIIDIVCEKCGTSSGIKELKKEPCPNECDMCKKVGL